MADSGTASFGETVRDLWELLKSYALQETVTPLKGLGWYLAYGLGAALTTSLGVGLILLGVLRLIQAEGRRYADAAGDSSVVPYLAVVVLSMLLVAFLANRIPKHWANRP